MPGSYTSPRKISVIRALRDEGFSNRKIAERLGKDRRTVDRIVKKLELGQDGAPLVKSGRPRKMMARDDRRLKNLVLRNRRASSGELSADLSQHGVFVSPQTVRGRLTRMGYVARRPRKKPLLTKRMMKARLDWAKAHIGWTVEEWKNVLWSDESKFNLWRNDGRQFVRRKSGEEFHPDCLERTVKHPASVMVWGCFSWYAVGRLHICEGMVNQQQYLHIIEDCLLPTMQDLEQDVGLDQSEMVFQQDSAPAHTARSVSN